MQPSSNPDNSEDEGFDRDDNDSEEEVDEVGGDGRRRAGRRRRPDDADDSGEYQPEVVDSAKKMLCWSETTARAITYTH